MKEVTELKLNPVTLLDLACTAKAPSKLLHIIAKHVKSFSSGVSNTQQCFLRHDINQLVFDNRIAANDQFPTFSRFCTDLYDGKELLDEVELEMEVIHNEGFVDTFYPLHIVAREIRNDTFLESLLHSEDSLYPTQLIRRDNSGYLPVNIIYS